MLKRKFFDYLLSWKSTPRHKPLLIKGQRQTGKTTIVREFAKTYEHYVELNFLENPSLSTIFEGDISVDTVITWMKLYFEHTPITPGSTLILLDEIQMCPRARTAMKWFAIDGRFDVIASGSLLGISDDMSGRGVSVPVGYESTVELKPLDFEEFLWALRTPMEAIEEVRGCIRESKPLHSALLSVFEKRFREYMVVGGMPEAVQRFVDTGDYTVNISLHRRLVETTHKGIYRYNRGRDRVKTRECYDSIPDQLSQSNKKFMYSRVKCESSRKSAEKYLDNLLWIKYAGYGLFCYSLNGLDLPLRRMVDPGSFRIYLPDTGTLVNLYGTGAMRSILNSDHGYNMGAVVENAVADCLVKAGFEPMYYRRTSGDNRMELDFVVESDDGINVIEVKSGRKREAPSISKVDPTRVARRIMLREGNISKEGDGVLGYPLFAAAFFKDVTYSETFSNLDDLFGFNRQRS